MTPLPSHKCTTVHCTSFCLNTPQVFVVPPSKMTFLPSKVEAVIGHTLQLPLQVKGYAFSRESPAMQTTLLPFFDCRKMKVSLSSSESSTFNISISSEISSTPGACLMVDAIATKPGHTRLTLTYKHKDIHLEASVTIAAYPPLIPVNPEVVAVVTLGSSKDFVFEGGPSPWILDRSKYYDRCECGVIIYRCVYKDSELYNVCLFCTFIVTAEKSAGVTLYHKPPLQGEFSYMYMCMY